MHALIIDDDINNLEVLEGLLASEDFSVTAVQNPEMLPEVISQLQQVDLVFLDLEMPQANGYDVFDALVHEFNITAPIIACTVHTNEVNAARKVGFYSFLPKPLDVERFPRQLSRILNQQPVWEVL